MHDPFAAAVALNPGIATVRPATVDVEQAVSSVRTMTDAMYAATSSQRLSTTLLATFAALAVTFWAPHAIVGLASGGLTASGWAIVSRRMRGLRRGARTFAI